MIELPDFASPLGPGEIGEMLAGVRLVAFDFDGVFTDNTVYVMQNGHEAVRCWRSDGIGLARLQGAGVHVVILSTEANPVVAARAAKLKTRVSQGVEDKAAALLEYCSEFGVDPRHSVFVGNDINDIPALKAVGVPVAVRDAYPDVLKHVVYRTHRLGGHGAVREVCDLVCDAKTVGQSSISSHED